MCWRGVVAGSPGHGCAPTARLEGEASSGRNRAAAERVTAHVRRAVRGCGHIRPPGGLVGQ